MLLWENMFKREEIGGITLTLGVDYSTGPFPGRLACLAPHILGRRQFVWAGALAGNKGVTSDPSVVSSLITPFFNFEPRSPQIQQNGWRRS